MTTPDFVLALPAKIGTDLLPMVGTTAIVRNRAGQVLLGRRADTGGVGPAERDRRAV